MSEQADRRRVDYQKFFDALEEGDWEKAESVFRGMTNPDFILHTVSKPQRDRTLNEFFEDFHRDFKELAIQKITVVNWFCAGDIMTLHGIFDVMNKKTNEISRFEGFGVDRFEGEKIAEEWEWVL